MQKKKSTHLTADDSIRIEALLNEGSSGCTKKCKTCHKAKQYCSNYVKSQCDTLLDANHTASHRIK